MQTLQKMEDEKALSIIFYETNTTLNPQLEKDSKNIVCQTNKLQKYEHNG